MCPVGGNKSSEFGLPINKIINTFSDSILAITSAAPSCNGFQTPYIKASTTPWWTNHQNFPIITSNQNKEPNPELACISTNQNIFNIVEESKAHCKGQDYRVTFYLQTDDDYTKLDSFLMDKHLFHNLLMKYSDWSLTSEKVGSINKEQTIKDNDELHLHGDNLNEHFKDPLTSSGQTKWPIIVRLLEKDKFNRPKDRKCVCDGLEHQDTANAQSNTNNDKDEKYHTINPVYNSKYKFYEVAIPEYIDSSSSPKTINVYIDKNIKNDEYDIKLVEQNKSYTEETNKSEPENQNATLKDFVKNHKISEIIDILFNDENVSYNKPILFDCNGTDTDIVNSDVKHIYSTGDSAEYHKDVNGYFKNIETGETISDSGSNEVCNREPKIAEILNSTDNYNNEFVITDTADSTVNSYATRNNTGGVNNYYYKLLNDESFQATEPTGAIPIINTSYSVDVNPTVLSSQSDKFNFTQTSKEPNFFMLPLTETEKTESTQHINCEYTKIKNSNEISCEYDKKPTESPYLNALLDTENQKPFYTIDNIPFLDNPEDYPVPPQVVYSKPVPNEDTKFYINAKISVAPSISSDSDTEAFYIIHHNITQEESKKPTSDNEILPTADLELEMPISELSQNLQSVPNITSSFSVEPLAYRKSSKTMELSPITQISQMPKIIPNCETLDITPFSLSTTSPSTDGTPLLKPFVKMSQLSIPQEDATFTTFISFPQFDIISHLPEITKTNKPAVLTPINLAMSHLKQRNNNLKAPKTISRCRTPFIHLKTSEPLSVSPVLPTIVEPFSSFYSSNSQNMPPMPVESWLTPVSSLQKYKLSTKSGTPKSDIPISSSIIEAELLPVQTPTISVSRQNLQPKFDPLSLANPRIKIYTEVPNGSTEILTTSSKEPLMIYPLPINKMKPVDHDQEPYIDSWSTTPIQTNLFPKLSLPLVTAPSRITLSPPITPSVTVSPLKYKNQSARDSFETIASPAKHKSLRTQKYSQPTLSPISSVPSQASTTSFCTSSPSTLAPSTFWQSLSKIQHLHSKPAQKIKPLSSFTPILLSDSDMQHFLPLPEVGTVASSLTRSPIYTNLSEIVQFTEQPTSTLTSAISNKPITYIQKLSNYEPSFQKLHYHIPSSTDFLLPITQDSTKLSHLTAELPTNSQFQQHSPIIQPIPTSNIASNILTCAEQPTKPYVESSVANKFNKIFPVTSSSSVLEPSISTYTSHLSHKPMARLLPSAYPQLETSYDSNLRSILSYTDIKNLFQAKPSAVSTMLPIPRSSLNYLEYLPDEKSSLHSFFVPISGSLRKTTTIENPNAIIPKRHFEPISASLVPIKDILKFKGLFQMPLPTPTDSLTKPCVYPFQEYRQVSEPNLLKTYAPYTSRLKVKGPFPPILKLNYTKLSDNEIISLNPISHAHSTVFSTIPVEVTKSSIIPTPLMYSALPTAFPASYTYYSEGNRQTKSPLRWSESLPIYKEPQKNIPQPIPLDNLSASPVLITPLMKGEPPSLLSDSTTHIPSPVTSPIYLTSFLRTPDKISSPLMYPAKPSPTLPYTHPSLLSPILMADTKPIGAITYKLSEPPNLVTPLSYTTKLVPKNMPNIPSERINFKEILPCECRAPLSPVSYHSSSQKVSKVTPVWITPNLAPYKIYPLTSLSLVKTKTDPVIPLNNNNIPIQTDIQAIPSSGLPTSFLHTVSNAFSALPLEETTLPTMPPSSLITGLKPSEFTSPLLRLKYSPQLIQKAGHGIPLRPFTSTTSKVPQSKKKLSSQHSPIPYLQEAVPSSVFLKPSTPIASYLLEPIPEGLKSLRLNNTESPKWRRSDTSSSSPTTPVHYIINIPLTSDETASSLINTLGTSLLDRVSKPYSQSYVPTYKPVYTEILSTPVIAASSVEATEPILQAPNINKIKYTPLNYYPKSVSGLPQPASYKSEYIPQIISPLQPSEMLNKPIKVLYSNYPQSSILNKYTPNFYKLLSQSETPCHIDANVPNLLAMPATPSSLPYRRPQISKPCQSLSPTMIPLITPTSLTINSYTQLPSSSYLSKGTKPVGGLLYYPISEAVEIPATTSASSNLRTQNMAPSSPRLPYTQIGDTPKVMSSPSWYTSYSVNLETPAIPQTVSPSSNSNLVSYLTVDVSSKTLKPQLITKQLPVNALESITPVKILSVNEYKSPNLYQTPVSPLSPIFIPELSSGESSPLKVLVYTTPLKDSGLVYLPSPKLSISAPSRSFAAITPISPLKESSEYVTPLRNAYSLQSISNSLTKTLPASIQPIPVSECRQISSPNFSKSLPCKYAILNFPRHILPTTAPLNTLQYAVPKVSSPLSKQRLYEYKPAPYSVLDASNPITPVTELSSVASIKPSLLDSAAISSVMTSQIPLSQTVCPKLSRNLSAKRLFSKDTINTRTASLPPPASISYSVISNTNLLVPPNSRISPLLLKVNTPTLPESMKSGHIHNSCVKSISSPRYINCPVIAQRPQLPKFVSSTPYLQSLYSSPLTSEIGTASPILPIVPSMPVETSLPKETHNIQSETIVHPQKLIPPFVTPVSSSLPMPTSSSQTVPGPYTYTTPYVPVASSPMISSVACAPIRMSDPYLQYFDPQFNTIYSTPQNAAPSSNTFTKYFSPLKYQSYYPSISSVYSTKPCPNSRSQLPLVTPLQSTPKLSPYKYGQFGLIYPAPQSKPCTNVPLPIYSDKLASPTTITHHKPFANEMPTYSKASSFKPAMSTMSSPPAEYPSEISAVHIKTDLPSVTSVERPYDNTKYVIPESSLPTINLKSDDSFITPVDSSLSKTLSTSSPLLFLSKLSPSIRSQLTYPQALPIKAPGVLSKYTSQPVILSPLKQFSYYPSTFTVTNLKKSSDNFTYSNTPLSNFKSPQSTSTYVTPLSNLASTQHITPYNPSITSQNANYYTPLKSIISNAFPTPAKSRVVFNSKPYLNIGLSPTEVSSTIINTQFLPFTSSTYITPESASLKLATNVVSPVPKLMSSSSSRLIQSLSYPQPRTPLSTPVSYTLHPSLLSSSLLKPIYSTISPSQYSPVETPVSHYPSYMPAEPSHVTSNTPVNSPLTHTSTSNYKNEVLTSSPLSVPYASQKPLLTSKGFSSLPTIQFSPYSSLSSNHRYMPLTYPKYRTLYPKPMNTASKDISFQNSQFIQTYYTPLSSIAKQSSPLKPMQSIDSLSTSSPPIPTISASSSNLQNYNTFQSLFKPEYISGKPISPFLLNQFYDKNSSMFSITNNFTPLQNEMKSRLYNYVKNNDYIKAHVYNSNVHLSIPLDNILVAKKVCDDPMVHTISPSIGLKMWPSNLKLLEAKLELKFKDVSVTNFQPVVNNLDTHDLNEVVNLIKSYIRNKYGEVIVLDNNNHLNNEYEAIKHCNNAKNKCNLLWPVETSCHSVKAPLTEWQEVA
ncbi:unnamed protein product [Arctia plantaginis]|uniref:Uncharacterized protein n=1 Tax=Arctia plantaginis TaxID=874455 RepID=A0A8S0ZSY9_ARCPL|nr:unnamed protein product [Arctia plantaginis]